ncbi:MAG: sigma-54 dependent transcriptional regulator [Myxococcota bacterium]|nr:sigma-54 dependent transcriptional regulator [Myxococcota bacterium]
MKRSRLLVVDDELSIREILQILFERDGYEVYLADSAEAAIRILEKNRIDLVLSDLNLPQLSGIDLLRLMREKYPKVVFVMITAYGSNESAVEAMKLGASNYVLKPFNNDELRLVVQRALGVQALTQENQKLKEGNRLLHFGYLVGSSPAMLEVYELIRRVKDSKINCMIIGESGTGKEMVARAIHHSGSREKHPFVAINCGAIPENLVESELFGHKKGSFTGAFRNKVGLLKAASGGTVFLDEIDALPLAVQVKLLRVIQERRFIPVGGVSEEQVDLRIISATNTDLEDAVRGGRFRDDLFYRLNVVELALPALRDRGDDIVELAKYFMDKFALEYNKFLIGIAPDALDALKSWPFFGNVRELQNLIERAVALSVGNVLQKTDFPPNFQSDYWSTKRLEKAMEIPDEGVNLDAILAEIEKKWLMAAMSKANGHRGNAASLLKMSFRSFRYRLAKYGMESDK